jgi:hypothetical protein
MHSARERRSCGYLSPARRAASIVNDCRNSAPDASLEDDGLPSGARRDTTRRADRTVVSHQSSGPTRLPSRCPTRASGRHPPSETRHRGNQTRNQTRPWRCSLNPLSVGQAAQLSSRRASTPARGWTAGTPTRTSRAGTARSSRTPSRTAPPPCPLCGRLPSRSPGSAGRSSLPSRRRRSLRWRTGVDPL